MALEAIPQALWFFLPAFVANPFAVVFGGGASIDGGRSLSDGQRMFGDGKTWRGLVGASAVLALGALLGDLAGAFVKRRMHLPRGAKASGLDQYDFVVGGLLVSLLIPSWSVPRFFSGDALLGLLAIIVITPALHRAVNLVGFRMGKKHEPW